VPPRATRCPTSASLMRLAARVEIWCRRGADRGHGENDRGGRDLLRERRPTCRVVDHRADASYAPSTGANRHSSKEANSAPTKTGHVPRMTIYDVRSVARRESASATRDAVGRRSSEQQHPRDPARYSRIHRLERGGPRVGIACASANNLIPGALDAAEPQHRNSNGPSSPHAGTSHA